VGITVKNQGSGNAVGTFYLEYYFDSTYIGRVSWSGLTAGATQTSYWYAQTWPSDANAHTLKGIVDPYSSISESNEGNNQLSKQFTARVNQPPTCSVTANPRSGQAPLTVTFTMSASDPDGSISAWVLDVDGDGNKDYWGTGSPPSTKTHTYTSPGPTSGYSVVFMVSDNNGATAFDTETVVVGANSPPTCSLSVNPASGPAPLTVTFTMSASDSDGSITTWVLDPGDENPSYPGSGNPPSTKSHTYSTPGSYTAILMVSDDKDATTSDSQIINVSSSDTVKPTISIASPSSGSTFTTSTITVSGIASDNVGISKVEVKVGAGSWQLASGTTSWSKQVTLSPGSNTIYARATDTSENTKETSVTVTYIPSDTIDPTISVTSPSNGSAFTTSAITVSGTASDNVGINKVEVKIGAGSWQLVSGTQSWSKQVTLSPGSNTIYARATDTSGRIRETSVTVTYNPPSIPLSFTSLTPSSITTSASTYDAELTAIGTNFNNVNRVIFTWSGPDSRTDIWDKGDSDWNSKVTVNSDTSMTLRPRILSDETSSQTKTWTWTVTLRDTIGATASRSFTVTYTPTSGDLNAILQELTIDRLTVNVAGQTYFILTLEHHIDPTTLQIVANSEQTKLYVDVNGNPVSDGAIAQKIGIIETAREMGDPQLSQRIAALKGMREVASRRTGPEWLNLVTSGVVNSIKAVQWQKSYDLYDYLRYWDATRDWWHNTQEATLRTQPTGILAAAATLLIKKLFGDPFGEIKKDLQNWLSGAINYYNSIEGMTNSEIVSYDEAYKFMKNFYYGKSKEDIASYLCDKLRHNIVNLFDSAAPVGKIYAVVGHVPLIGSTLALLEFPKLAEEARLATDWTVDTLYKDVVNRYQNNADLLYKLTDAAEYSLELAQAHEEVTRYKVKYLDEIANGYAEAQKIPQAVSDYLWDIDTWWDSFVTVMTLGRLQSPGEFRVYDSQGRVTGLVNGGVKEEIPDSVYADEAVLIFNSLDSYLYEVVGTDHGTYGLEITFKEGDEAEGLAFANVTIVPDEVHQYTTVGGTPSGGQAAATIEIDSDGDGVFEQTKTLGPPTAAFTFSPSTISINKEINFDASQSSDADGQIVSYQWNFGDGNTIIGQVVTHSYSEPGEYAVSLVVVDNDGVVSTYSRFVQVGERQGMPTWAWAIIAIGILVLAVIVFRKRRTAKVQG